MPDQQNSLLEMIGDKIDIFFLFLKFTKMSQDVSVCHTFVSKLGIHSNNSNI
jgi:hypothetical protein